MSVENQAQFIRLLAEIRAVGLTSNQYDDLTRSMDCTMDFIDSVLDDAEAAFEEIKESL